MTFKTPGVYVKEVSLFPPSVAEVETAIPAFIGYTEKAERKGEDLTNKPTKVSSLLEYQQLFGGAYPKSSIEVTVSKANHYAVNSITFEKRFYLYESLRLFFDNGGGKCYIVSVGNYESDIAIGNGTSPGLRNGLEALAKYDEPTIILFPDAALLSTGDELYSLQQAALAQCARLQDRVAVFDLYEGNVNGEFDNDVVLNFRSGIGVNNLKYGAAYTPWIYSAYPQTVGFNLFRDNVTDPSDTSVGDLAKITSDSELNALVTAANTAIADQEMIEGTLGNLRTGNFPTTKDRYKALTDAISSSNTDDINKMHFEALLVFLRSVAGNLAAWKGSLGGTNLASDRDTYAKSTLKPALESLIALEKNTDVLPLSDLENADQVNSTYEAVDATEWLEVAKVTASREDYDGGGARSQYDTIREILKDLDALFQESTAGNVLSFISQIREAAATHADMAQNTLYQGHTIIGNLVEHIKREMARIPPSGAVAGVYAFVDGSRGVWKAPANVSLSSVLGPVVPIDDADQEDLNVDVNAGKSINAVRSFSGRGTMVWGARTLAGNDNEWRYVAVRRFFNMVEESVKKSTSWAVFEPNAAPLWTKVKSMIDNYLIQKWRDGALAGATPDEAFFVQVGLGQTMTAQDILEGRLNVEIGMAVVRPAEFIILKFSHKMQES